MPLKFEFDARFWDWTIDFDFGVRLEAILYGLPISRIVFRTGLRHALHCAYYSIGEIFSFESPRAPCGHTRALKE